MIFLTRQVRLAINGNDDKQLSGKPTNSYGGFPSLTGFGHFLAIDVTLAGELNHDSQYLVNIKEVDAQIREHAVPILAKAIEQSARPAELPVMLFDTFKSRWSPAKLRQIKLHLSPFLSFSCRASEYPMIQLSQKFEFSAAHRLHNPKLSDEQNRSLFGKCNNPLGHGHNYELQVTLVGQPEPNGSLIDLPVFERIVAETVVERFDHRNLNEEVAEFREVIPTVENIAVTIYRLLKPKFAGKTKLSSVIVWETAKTWCEYSE